MNVTFEELEYMEEMYGCSSEKELEEFYDSFDPE